MADVITIIAELLKISPNLIDKYTQQGPIYGAFFLIFFPTLFLLIFVYLIGTRFMKHKAFSLLISVAVYAFIVLQGFYSWFVILAEYWIFLLIFLGVFYFLFKRNEGGGGGQVGKRGIFTSLGEKTADRLWKGASGQEKDLVTTIESQLNLLNDLKPGDRDLASMAQQTKDNLDVLRQMTAVGGKVVGGHHARLLNRFKEITAKKGLKIKTD